MPLILLPVLHQYFTYYLLTMAIVELLKLQLVGLVASMSSEGLLDEQFNYIGSLQIADNPGFTVRAITTFFGGMEKFLTRADRLLNETVVDFSRLTIAMNQLKGSCSMIGAQSMNLAAIPLIEFAKANDRNGFMNVLRVFKSRYLYMRSKLEMIMQLEKQILEAGGEAEPSSSCGP